MPTTHILSSATVLFLAVTAACGQSTTDDPGAHADTASTAATADEDDRVDRPLTLTDTIAIEGMGEPLELRLFRTDDDFPLPFTAYVPADMGVDADAPRTVHFTAVFGGTRSEDAYMHLYIFPAGTEWQQAMATARGYTTSRGVPVSRGIEPLDDDSPPIHPDWAAEAFRFRYQAADGEWYMGTLGVGRHEGRSYMIVRHIPVEYADGFSPRADIILETWQWDDGSPLTGRDP